MIRALCVSKVGDGLDDVIDDVIDDVDEESDSDGDSPSGPDVSAMTA